VELSAELASIVRDLGGAAGRSGAQACQVVESRTREGALASLLGLLTETATLRDLAAELYVRLIEWDGEG
jgi:hypothetical protein